MNLFGIGLLTALLFTACNKDSDIAGTAEATPDVELTLADILTPPGAVGFRAPKEPAIWSDCEAFGTNGTTANFKPTAGNFDELYNGANFAEGLGAISESKPGDRDYNGGRWHVNTLRKGVDPDKYNDVCMVEDIDLSDFVSTSTYFECPLRPIH